MVPAITALSTTRTAAEYVQCFFPHIICLWNQFDKPFYRKWRARSFALRQSALAKTARFVVGLGPPPAVQRVDDQSRQERRRAALRAGGRMIEDGVLPPVVAFGGGRWPNIRGNPPVPRTSVVKTLSRIALVVMTPEYNTSKVIV